MPVREDSTRAATMPGRGRLVWLLRHAKTLVDPPAGGGDHQRELDRRGRRDADAFAVHLAPDGDRFGFTPAELPELVLCSTAIRTRQTAERALAEMEDPPAVDLRRELYRADPDDVVDVLRRLPDDIGSVMVVGHNPTAHQLAASLGRPDEPGDATVVEQRGFPTCALAVFRLPVDVWGETALGTAHLTGLFTPPY